MEEPAGFTPLIAIHAVAAAYVLLLGPINILRRQRDRTHRFIGYTWVGVMAVTCFSSFGIVHAGGFSWLHALSVYTLFSIGAGVWSIVRSGNRVAHRYNMIGAYLGTLIAFVFAAAIPSRRIPQLALNDPASLALAAALVVASALGFFLAVLRGGRRTGTAP